MQLLFCYLVGFLLERILCLTFQIFAFWGFCFHHILFWEILNQNSIVSTLLIKCKVECFPTYKSKCKKYCVHNLCCGKLVRANQYPVKVEGKVVLLGLYIQQDNLWGQKIWGQNFWGLKFSGVLIFGVKIFWVVKKFGKSKFGGIKMVFLWSFLDRLGPFWFFLVFCLFVICTLEQIKVIKIYYKLLKLVKVIMVPRR